MKLKEFFVKQKITPNKKDAEDGRSMVEMLGVLAIIGVLSIGGIAGYTMAMNRYRANEIIDIASKVAVIAMSKSECHWTGVCANMDEVTQSYNVAGAKQIYGFQNGSVGITGPMSEGTYNAIKSIAGNKFVDGVYVDESDYHTIGASSILLNFEKH